MCVLPCCSPCPTPICGSGWSPAGLGTSQAPPASPATSAGSSHLETAKTTFTPVILHTVHSCHQPTDVWRWMFWIVCRELLKNLRHYRKLPNKQVMIFVGTSNFQVLCSPLHILYSSFRTSSNIAHMSATVYSTDLRLRAGPPVRRRAWPRLGGSCFGWGRVWPGAGGRSCRAPPPPPWWQTPPCSAETWTGKSEFKIFLLRSSDRYISRKS